MEGDVVSLGGDGVHAVGWGTGENFVVPWYAEGADESVNDFVGADAHEEVGRGEGR